MANTWESPCFGLWEGEGSAREWEQEERDEGSSAGHSQESVGLLGCAGANLGYGKTGKLS